MDALTVRAYCVREDIHLDLETQARLGRWSFDEIQRQPAISRHWISIVCLAHNPHDDLLYCGLTAYDNDIVCTFDMDRKVFRSLGFQRVGERFDVKVHRSLEVDEAGNVYGATACLHDIDQLAESPGGKVFRYDPRQDRFDILAIPVPRQYIQTIALDRSRRIIYGFSYPVTHLFRLDLDTGQSRDLGYTGLDPHSPAFDDRGHLWGTWRQSYGLGHGTPPRASLLHYDPDADRLTWHRGLSLSALYPGDIGYPDSVVNGGDGFLYFGTNVGALVRFDPRTLEVRYLGRPLAAQRLPGLIVGHDGRLFGCGGEHGDTRLFAYDRESGRFSDCGRLADPARGEACRLTHWLSEPRPGLFYVGETDNLARTGYLWECQLRQ